MATDPLQPTTYDPTLHWDSGDDKASPKPKDDRLDIYPLTVLKKEAAVRKPVAPPAIKAPATPAADKNKIVVPLPGYTLIDPATATASPVTPPAEAPQEGVLGWLGHAASALASTFGIPTTSEQFKAMEKEFSDHPVTSLLKMHPAYQATHGLYEGAKRIGGELSEAGEAMLSGPLSERAEKAEGHLLAATPFVGELKDPLVAAALKASPGLDTEHNPKKFYAGLWKAAKDPTTFGIAAGATVQAAMLVGGLGEFDEVALPRLRKIATGGAVEPLPPPPGAPPTGGYRWGEFGGEGGPPAAPPAAPAAAPAAPAASGGGAGAAAAEEEPKFETHEETVTDPATGTQQKVQVQTKTQEQPPPEKSLIDKIAEEANQGRGTPGKPPAIRAAEPAEPTHVDRVKQMQANAAAERRAAEARGEPPETHHDAQIRAINEQGAIRRAQQWDDLDRMQKNPRRSLLDEVRVGRGVGREGGAAEAEGVEKSPEQLEHDRNIATVLAFAADANGEQGIAAELADQAAAHNAALKEAKEEAAAETAPADIAAEGVSEPTPETPTETPATPKPKEEAAAASDPKVKAELDHILSSGMKRAAIMAELGIKSTRTQTERLALSLAMKRIEAGKGTAPVTATTTPAATEAPAQLALPLAEGAAGAEPTPTPGATPTAEAAPETKAAGKPKGRKKKPAPPAVDLADWYTPGNVLHKGHWNNYEKVLEFNPPGADGRWTVKVVDSDKDGNPVPGERVRVHSTPPDAKKDRVVVRAPEAAPAAAQEAPDGGGWEAAPPVEAELADARAIAAARTTPSAKSDAVRAGIGKWLKRAADEQQGQNLHEEMIANGESPREIETKFWTDTYFKLPAAVQGRFQRYLKSITGFQPGSLIAIDKDGNGVFAESWPDIAVHPKFGSQLPTDPEHLEGIERGYAVLMREANNRLAGVSGKATTPAPQVLPPPVEAPAVPPAAPKAAAAKEAPSAAPPAFKRGDRVRVGTGEPPEIGTVQWADDGNVQIKTESGSIISSSPEYVHKTEAQAPEAPVVAPAAPEAQPPAAAPKAPVAAPAAKAPATGPVTTEHITGSSPPAWRVPGTDYNVRLVNDKFDTYKGGDHFGEPVADLPAARDQIQAHMSGQPEAAVPETAAAPAPEAAAPVAPAPAKKKAVGAKAQEKSHAEARARTRDENAALVTGEKATRHNAPVIAANDDAMVLLDRLLGFIPDDPEVARAMEGGFSNGIAIKGAKADQIIADLRQLAEDDPEAHRGLTAFADLMESHRTPNGNVIIHRSIMSDAKLNRLVLEELFHDWQYRHVAKKILEMNGRMLLGPSAKAWQTVIENLLKSYKYKYNQATLEAPAWVASGDFKHLGIDDEQAVKLLADYFEAAHGVIGSEAIKVLPPMDKALEGRVHDEIKGRNLGKSKENVPGGNRRRVDTHQPAPSGQPEKLPRGAGSKGRRKAPETELTQSRQRERDLAPVWYLKSERVVADKMKGPMPGPDALRMLQNNGISQDELKWTGLDDYLPTAGRVTPDQVREHIAENGIKVEEIKKGEVDPRERASARERRSNAITQLADAKREIEERGYSTERWQNVQDASRRMHEAEDETARIDSRPDSSKYASHVLPGGENYRELLLTLPGVGAPRSDLKVVRAQGFEDPRWNVVTDKGTLLSVGFRSEEAARSKLAQLAEKQSTSKFQSGHWGEPNVVTHVRMNDRTTPDGKRLLHLEEIQSDWHQKGRKEGYAPALTEGETKALPEGSVVEQITPQAWQVTLPEGTFGRNIFYGDSRENAEANARSFISKPSLNAVPDAPFRKTWQEMALRRMVRYAAEHGYDGVSWTGGDDQAERYDLSKHVDWVEWNGDTLTAGKGDRGDPDSPNLIQEHGVGEAKLPDVIGKEAAAKLIQHRAENPNRMAVLKGLDLKVGGEGMRGFYDKIVPNYLNKFGKKFRARVGETEIESASGNPYSQYEGPEFTVADLNRISKDRSQNGHVRDQAEDVAAAMEAGGSYDKAIVEHGSAALAAELNGDLVTQQQAKPVQYLPITDEMYESALGEGMPLFQNRQPEGPAPLETVQAEAEEHKPENWIRRGVKEFTEERGGQFITPPKVEADSRAMEIADAYEDMKHEPDNPAVKASYDALKADLDKQWDLATKKMGITFEPWDDRNSQPYKNSAEMKADVENNKHLFFFRGGDLPPDHPLVKTDPQTGFNYNEKMRAVHDLFGHAIEGHQFGPKGEEMAWLEHSQAFRPEAIPALTTETKGQNSWVNSGPQMRGPDGSLLKKGDPGWKPASEREYAKNKAGLLPRRFYYRQEAPVVFVSPNVFDLPGVPEAQAQLTSRIHKQFAEQAHQLAADMGLNVTVEHSLGSWLGGAENSIAIHLPIGTDPELVSFYEASLGRLGYQFATGSFIPNTEGKDLINTFWVDGKNVSTGKVAKVLLDNGIENSTITPADGRAKHGYAVTVIDTGNGLRDNLDKVTEELGVQSVDTLRGMAQFPGSSESRASAESSFSRILDGLEHKRPSLGEVRRRFESRPDYHLLYDTIRQAKEPRFVGVEHGSRTPELVQIDPAYHGKGPQGGGESKRKTAYPEYWIDRSYFQIKGTRGERPYIHFPHQYDAIFNHENLYDFHADPDGLKEQVPDSLKASSGGLATYYEKLIKDNGYDGYFDSERGQVAAFGRTPVEQKLKAGEIKLPESGEDNLDILQSRQPKKGPGKIKEVREEMERLNPRGSTVPIMESPLLPSYRDMWQIGDHLESYTRQTLKELRPGDTSAEHKAMVDRVVRIARDELKYQLAQENSGVDWYKKDVRGPSNSLISEMKKLHPELDDPVKERMFLLFTAGTSPGKTAAFDNANIAEQVYDLYKGTKKVPLRNPDGNKPWGTYGNAPLQTIQALLDHFGGDEAKATEWMLTKHPLKELEEIKGKTRFSEDTVENALPPDYDPEAVYGSYILGKKVGPFNLNLNGISTELTVDIWFMRTWNRLMGTLVGPDPKGKKKLIVLDKPRGKSERAAMIAAVDKLKEEFGLETSQVQAALWYYEQGLYNRLGKQGTYGGTYADAARDVYKLRSGGFTSQSEADAYEKYNALQGTTGGGAGPHPEGVRAEDTEGEDEGRGGELFGDESFDFGALSSRQQLRTLQAEAARRNPGRRRGLQ